MKKILITAYFFWPEINPRAFRTYELAKELARLGYEVDVVIPDIKSDHTDIEIYDNLHVHKILSGYILNKNAKVINKNIVVPSEKKQTNKFLKKIMKQLFYCIFIGGKSIEYGILLYKFLLTRKDRYDGVISIGLPISVHIATSLYISKNNYLKDHSIADYGDPFSSNTEIPSCFYYRYLEKYILKNFRYIAVPIQGAIEKFKYFKSIEHIKVIPQGYDFSDLTIAKYHKNDIPTFGYAGIFYQRLRNPELLFEFLVKLKFDFRFVIYTDTTNQMNMKMLLPYIEKLKYKLIINHFVPREECIYELSKMDFIINQNNLGKEQSPSKLIDYMLAMRPIFNFSQENFDEKEFLKFLEYKNRFDDHDIKNYQVELEKFKSSNVAKQFLDLLFFGSKSKVVENDT